METLYLYHSVPDRLKGGVLAIGNYDGVHRGHQIILEKVRDIAVEAQRPAGVLCFDPNPRQYFFPQEPHFYLSSQKRKLELLDYYGMDLTVVLPFDEAMANFTPENFASRVLCNGLGISHIVVGYNFYFGKGRQGTPESLIEFGRKYGFEVTVIPEQRDDQANYSSTRIRDLLRAGQVRNAAELLGYWWKVEGTVISGAKQGAELGFPTANINLLPGQDLGQGIYAVYAYLNKKRYMGAAYLGSRPTFDNGKPVLEVFLFDFDGDLYGQQLEVEFIEFIREDQKYSDVDALISQMEVDCDQARRILSDEDAVSSIPSV